MEQEIGADRHKVDLLTHRVGHRQVTFAVLGYKFVDLVYCQVYVFGDRRIYCVDGYDHSDVKRSVAECVVICAEVHARQAVCRIIFAVLYPGIFDYFVRMPVQIHIIQRFAA